MSYGGADVAQLVERWFCKPNVAGSFPAIGSTGWCNGSTKDFGPFCLGSNPSPVIYSVIAQR